MNAWSHLPNAHHIDRIFESAKSHPEIWDEISKSTWDTSSAIASLVVKDSYKSDARNAAWDTAKQAIRDSAWDTANYAGKRAVAALIVYDNCAHYLDMPSDQLSVWAMISEDLAAVLLLPAVTAFERINELECV
jgi:hypothetical protein